MDHRMQNLEVLYRDVGPDVLRFLRRSLASAADADELLQESFLVVARDYAALENARSQRAWLIGIARKLVSSHRRRSAIRRTLSLTDEPVATPPTPEQDEMESIRSAIAGLPTAQQEVLQLRLTDDLSYAEIAEALGIPIGTVRSRIHTAVATIRRRQNADARPIDEASRRIGHDKAKEA
jgi:RNA polymerase sigma-70 factor (ECF subfamily)